MIFQAQRYWFAATRFWRSGFLGILFSLSALAAVAGAQDLSKPEMAALAETVRRFDEIMQSRDFESLVRIMPPRIIKHFLETGELEEDELVKALAKVFAEVFAKVTLHSFAMDLPTAIPKQLPDGTSYVFIPTETVMSVEGVKILTGSYTLALMDEGQWRLMRISDLEQLFLLTKVYPEFRGLKFPGDSTEILKE